MRILLQRVRSASVEVNGQEVGAIGQGLLLFYGAGASDTPALNQRMADKVAHLRIFSDDDDKMNLSLLDIGGEALVVSQFTLYANCKKGRRPHFGEAAPPKLAESLYDHFVVTLRDLKVPIQTGVFAADMRVHLENDGPVTIWLDSGSLFATP